MLGGQLKTVVKTTLSFLGIYEDWLLERVLVYLPGDINEFFAGNTTVRNELVHVLDALLRLKQLTRKEYADITARIAAPLWLYRRVDVWQREDTGMEDLEL